MSRAQASIEDVFRAQQAHQMVVKRTGAAERAAKLRRLRDGIRAREDAIRAALHADFRKSPTEVDLTELFATLAELKDAIHHVDAWMKPEKVPTPMSLMGTSSWIHYEPRGVVLIIGPWNYPFQLVIAPLVAAIAAGNCVIVKPSELTPRTSAVLVELIGAIFDEREVAIFEGGPDVATRLLALPFDHFFFTGSTRVGKIVAKAAAEHLATTTLELGGKSPAVVDDTADLAKTARRLVWGKYVNAGQTCIAPDYVLVQRGRRDQLVTELRRAIAESYGATPDAQKQSADLCRVIDDRNYARLVRLLDGTVERGGKVAIGGERDAAQRYLAPTVLTDVPADSPIMAEEIFGPILPILTYDSIDEVAPFITRRDKPLAMYVFSEDGARTKELIAETTAGGTVINNTVLHFANTNLPFGGVGASGSGNYHGLFGFRAFSHARAVLRQGRLDLGKKIYAPYDRDAVKKMVKFLFKWFA